MAGFCAAVWMLMMLTHCASSRSIVSRESHFDWSETKYMLAFGDSYTFVQGTAGYPELSFIGDNQNLAFSKKKLLSDKIVQNFTGTANGGPNWIERVTGCGVKSGETSPQSCDIQLWDFAFGGAHVSSELLPQPRDYTTPLVNQTQQYLTWGEPVIGKDMDKSKALVAIWIGINDVIHSASSDDVSYQDFYDTLVSAVIEQSAQPMYDVGFKNFLFLNLPPLDRAPANVLVKHNLPNQTMIGAWNDALEKHTKSFAAANPVAKAMLYDANGFLNGVLDSPKDYGIKNTKSYCASSDKAGAEKHPGLYGCRPLDEYFWRNAGHM